MSLVLLNTDKARALAPRIRELADCGEFEFEECLKYNVPLREKVAPHPAAEKFRALIRQKDFSTAVEETLGKQSFLQRCSGLFLRLFPIRAQHKISAGSKKLTGSAKILISKILPRALFEKIMRKWAKLNGRKYVPENERKGDG